MHVPFWVLDATYEIQATCTSHNWSLSTCGDFLGMIGEVHNKTYSFQIKLEAKNLACLQAAFSSRSTLLETRLELHRDFHCQMSRKERTSAVA